MSDMFRTRPEWLRGSGFLTLTLPEPPQTQKYRGAQVVESEEAFEACFSDAALSELKAAGVGLVRVRFFSGFGLEFEKAAADRMRQYIQAAHAHGIKVAALVSLGGLVPETLLLDEPESRNWLQVDGQGQSVAEDALREPFRLRPCYNSEGFMRYMERVCNAAVDTGADLIHFESVGYNAEPETCRCPTCVIAFRDFLRNQHGPIDEQTRARGHARFGHNNFTHTRPPLRSPALDAQVDGPHQQEWQRYKAQVLAQCLERLGNAITRRNIQCAVGAELADPVNGAGAGLGADAALQALHIDLLRLAPCQGGVDGFGDSARHTVQSAARKKRRKISQEPDLFSSHFEGQVLEAPPRALVLPQSSDADADHEGSVFRHVFDHVRELKSAQGLGVNVESRRRGLDLQTGLALNLAFDPAALMSVAEVFHEDAGEESRGLVRQFADFYGRHQAALYKGAQPLQPCAVLQDSNGLAFNPHTQRSSLQAIEAWLLEKHVGYAHLYSAQLDKLANFRCVILPNGLCLDDDAVQKLTQHVHGGGTLVAVEDAGLRDQWRRLRTQPALASLLGQELLQPVYKEAGQGRVVYLPKFESALMNEALLFCSVLQSALEVESDTGRVLAQVTRTASGEGAAPALVVHAAVLNKGRARLRCSVVCDTAPAEVVLYSPFCNPVPVENQFDNGRLNITAAEVSGYLAIKIQ
jgi:hypothetical protein